MLVGRDYRKSISQGVAYNFFRWIALWLIIAYCASKGTVGTAIALTIVAADILYISAMKAIVLVHEIHARKDWLDRLTNRVFYRVLWERTHFQVHQNIDIDSLFREAAAEARRDLQMADEASRLDGMDSKAWHMFGGITCFIGLWVSSLFYYGSALMASALF